MIVPPYFIAGEAVFDRLRSNLEFVVRMEVRLPLVPFRESFKPCGFEEFDWAMSGDFWPFLQGLAMQSGDHELVFCALEPDPVQYYKAAFGYYNWAVLPVSLSNNEYWDFLNVAPIRSPADSMLANAQTLVFTASSKRWAIWCEREVGLCVLAHRNDEKPKNWNDLNWVKGLYPTEEWSAFSHELVQQFRSHLASEPLVTDE